MRTATMADCPAIAQLIKESVRTLCKDDYSEEQIEAALGGPWGLDTQLVKDGTYFLVHVDGALAACGGWSFRKTLFGSDREESRDAALVDPALDAARIRAFFVRPQFARQGIASAIMEHCEQRARKAGFRAFSLGATLPGRRLYEAHGFVSAAPFDYDLGGGLSMQVFPMTKRSSGQGDGV